MKTILQLLCNMGKCSKFIISEEKKEKESTYKHC